MAFSNKTFGCGGWPVSDNIPPKRVIGPREFIGGMTLMAMGFGVNSWASGRDIPWGYQQTYGAALFGIGLVGSVVVFL
jgi:hypothetical protein